MQLRILGAHNQESRDTRMESHLIDGVLALDAGSLTRALTFEEQKRIRAIILSHRHFDHVKDLLPLGIAVRETGVTIDIFGIKDTLDFVRSRLLDGSLFPDFLKSPSPEKPTFRLHEIEFYQEFRALDYKAVAVPVPHAVPAAGFQVASGDARLFYTGDTGRGVSDAWEHVSPNVLLSEVTFGNAYEARADEVGHLTPKLLGQVLDKFRATHRYLPRVIASHINPPWEEAVRQELAELKAQMGLDLLIGEPDSTINL